jgi:hypothetical protein
MTVTKRTLFGFLAGLPFIGTAMAAISIPPFRRLTLSSKPPHLLVDRSGRHYSIYLSGAPEIVDTIWNAPLEVWDNGADLVVIRPLLPSEGAVAQWQSIESAPRDGTCFLALIIPRFVSSSESKPFYAVIRRIDDKWRCPRGIIGYADDLPKLWTPIPGVGETPRGYDHPPMVTEADMIRGAEMVKPPSSPLSSASFPLSRA